MEVQVGCNYLDAVRPLVCLTGLENLFQNKASYFNLKAIRCFTANLCN